MSAKNDTKNGSNRTPFHFTSGEQTLENIPGPEPKITMLSPEGKALAERTAPDSAYDTNISQSGVDKAMRGQKK